ncbi:MAG: hypothetical protein AAGD05_12020 [Bacteroidota bacterium]
MELQALPDYLLDDSILFVELQPVGLVVLTNGIAQIEDREPQSSDVIDCMLAYTSPDLSSK